MKRLPTTLTVTAVLVVIAIFWMNFRHHWVADVLSVENGPVITISSIENIDVIPHLSMHARGISIEDERFLRHTASIDSLIVDLDLADLVTGSLHIADIKVKSADIPLRNPSRGQSDGTLSWQLGSWVLDEVIVSYEDSDQNWVLNTTSCRGISADESRITLKCNGTIDDRPFTVSGFYSNDKDDSDAPSTNLKLNWGNLVFSVKGRFKPSTLTGTDLLLSLETPEGRPLFDLFGVHELRDGPLLMNAKVTGSGEGYAFNVSALSSELELRLVGTTSDFRNFREATLRYNFKGPSLYELGATIDYLDFEPLPFSASGEIQKKNNDLQLPRTSFRLGEGNIVGSAHYPDFPNTTGMKTQFKGENFPLTILQPAVGTCTLPSGLFQWTGTVARSESGHDEIHLSVTDNEHHLQVDGNLNVNEPGSHEFRLLLSGLTWAGVADCFNRPGFPEEPFLLQTMVNITSRGWQLTNLDLRSDQFDMTGSVGSTDGVRQVEVTIATQDMGSSVNTLFRQDLPLASSPVTATLKLSGPHDYLTLETLDVVLPGQSGQVSGTIGNPATLHDLDLNFAFTGDDLRYLLKDDERTATQPAPFSVKANVQRDPGAWLIKESHFTVAQTSVSGSGKLTDHPRFLGSAIDIDAQGSNIENILGPWVDHQLPRLSFKANASIVYNTDVLNVEELSVQVGGHSLVADFIVDNPPNFVRSEGTVSMTGDNIRELATILGLESNFLDRSYEADFSIDGGVERLTLRDLSLTAGESDLSGTVVFKNGDLPHLTIDLISESTYLPLFDASLLDETLETTTEEVRYLSSETFSPALLDEIEGKFQIEAKRVWTNERYSSAINVTGTLEDGLLNVDPLTWEARESSGTVRIQAHNEEQTLNLSVNIDSNRLPLVWLLAGEAIESSDTHFTTRVTSHGNSMSQIGANLNGAMLFKGGAGRVKSGLLDNVFGDFLHTITSKIMVRDNKETNIKCSAGAFSFKDGLASIDPGLVVRSDRVDIFTSGEIDLKTEKPDLTFFTRSRTGVGISPANVLAPQMKVTGTLASPTFFVDPKRTTISSSLAIFTGGLSVLAKGFWDRLIVKSKHPCASLYNEALKKDEFKLLEIEN